MTHERRSATHSICGSAQGGSLHLCLIVDLLLRGLEPSQQQHEARMMESCAPLVEDFVPACAFAEIAQISEHRHRPPADDKHNEHAGAKMGGALLAAPFSNACKNSQRTSSPLAATPGL